MRWSLELVQPEFMGKGARCKLKKYAVHIYLVKSHIFLPFLSEEVVLNLVNWLEGGGEQFKQINII